MSMVTREPRGGVGPGAGRRIWAGRGGWWAGCRWGAVAEFCPLALQGRLQRQSLSPGSKGQDSQLRSPGVQGQSNLHH